MPDPGKGEAACAPDKGSSAPTTEIQMQESSLRPLLRLRQLTGEIQSAFTRGDMEIVEQASNLLAPTISQWTIACPKIETGNVEIMQLTHETQRALTDCETLMQAAMAQIQMQSNQVRQQQQRLQRVRSQRAVPRNGRLLDARR